MTSTQVQELIDRLEGAVRAASISEETCRRDFVEKMQVLERTRVFAFRRPNLVKAVIDAMSGAEDEAGAVVRGKAAFLRELNWSGARRWSSARRLQIPIVMATDGSLFCGRRWSPGEQY